MHAEHAAVHDRAEREVVEHLAAPPPHVAAPVLALALVVEAVHLRDLPRLVVPPDEGDALRVPHLQREEEQEGLDAVEAPVDKVACGWLLFGSGGVVEWG